jgi:hypothetical protein
VSSAKLVFNGTPSSYVYLPTYIYYNYSLSQQIYKSSEIGRFGTIRRIFVYNNSSNAATRKIEIYMNSTSKTAFSDNSDWVKTGLNKVFSGSVTFEAHSWVKIDLDTPFDYNSGNLLLTVDDNTGQYPANFPSFDCYGTNEMCSLCCYRDNADISLSDPPSGTLAAKKNTIKLGFADTLISYVSVATIKNGSVVDEWSDPVRQSAEDGADGDEGPQGCTTRVSEWKSGAYYRNDEGKKLAAGTVGYIDVVAVETTVSSSNPEGYLFYMLKAGSYSGDSYYSTTNPANDSCWQQLSNVGPIYTSLLVARNAFIKFGTGNQFLITNSGNVVKVGMKGSGNVRIWAGSAATTSEATGSSDPSSISNAPFRVYDDGSAVLNKVTASGTINAKLFHSRTIQVSDILSDATLSDGNYHYTINPASKPFSMLFVDDDNIWLLTLPNASTYDGLELSFYVSKPRARTVAGAVYLLASGNIIRGIEKSDDGTIYEGYSTHNQICLGLNTYFTLKAFGGYWNVIEGNHNYTV